LTTIQLTSNGETKTLLAMVDTGFHMSALSREAWPDIKNFPISVKLVDATRTKLSVTREAKGLLQIGDANLGQCEFLLMDLKALMPPQLKNVDAIIGQDELINLSPISFDLKNNMIVINDTDNYDIVLPIKIVNNLPAIDVLLNGNKTRFVFDSGSYFSATVSDQEANSAKPSNSEESEYGSAAGIRLKSKRSPNNDLQLASIHFDAVDVWLEPTNRYPTLGPSFFKNHKIKIDYKKNTFSIKLQN
jgi:hypothetical protein